MTSGPFVRHQAAHVLRSFGTHKHRHGARRGSRADTAPPNARSGFCHHHRTLLSEGTTAGFTSGFPASHSTQQTARSAEVVEEIDTRRRAALVSQGTTTGFTSGLFARHRPRRPGADLASPPLLSKAPALAWPPAPDARHRPSRVPALSLSTHYPPNATAPPQRHQRSRTGSGTGPKPAAPAAVAELATCVPRSPASALPPISSQGTSPGAIHVPLTASCPLHLVAAPGHQVASSLHLPHPSPLTPPQRLQPPRSARQHLPEGPTRRASPRLLAEGLLAQLPHHLPVALPGAPVTSFPKAPASYLSPPAGLRAALQLEGSPSRSLNPSQNLPNWGASRVPCGTPYVTLRPPAFSKIPAFPSSRVPPTPRPASLLRSLPSPPAIPGPRAIPGDPPGPFLPFPALGAPLSQLPVIIHFSRGTLGLLFVEMGHFSAVSAG